MSVQVVCDALKEFPHLNSSWTDEGIVVKEQRLDPPPAERTELGVLTWSLELAPGQTKDIHVGVRVGRRADHRDLAGQRVGAADPVNLARVG